MQKLPDRRLLPVVLCAALLSSCASLPLPDSPNQSLLIIPTTMEKVLDNGKATLSSVTLDIVKNPGYQKIPVSLDRFRDYTTVALEPGEYTINSATINLMYSSGNSTRTVSNTRYLNSIPFFMEKNIVRFYEKCFRLENGTPFFAALNDTERSMNAPRQKELWIEIRRDSLWPAWEGYQLINTPSP